MDHDVCAGLLKLDIYRSSQPSAGTASFFECAAVIAFQCFVLQRLQPFGPRSMLSSMVTSTKRQLPVLVAGSSHPSSRLSMSSFVL
jgi:hypothetical protein